MGADLSVGLLAFEYGEGSVVLDLVSLRCLFEDRPKPQLGGLADQFDRSLLVVDAWDLNENCLSLPGHLGLTDPEAVDPVANDVDRLIEQFVSDLSTVGQRLGLEHHRRTALQIEAE